MSSAVYTLLGIVVGVLVLLVLIFKAMWRVAEPNEALIISGLRDKGTVKDDSGDAMGFRIVTGKGTLVVPGVQAVRKLSLDLHQADLQVECVTHQGIPVHVSGTVIFKIGDDQASITNAARRFLDQQNLMDQRVHNVFAGHLRSIVGGMTVENMIRDRELLTGRTREASGVEMAKLGLVVDSLQIQEIDDPTGYIKNLAMPHTAAVASAARIAQADADREATQREQEANALKAESERNAKIKQAGFQAEVDQANATAGQSGPLANATARQNVVVQETKAAELEAGRQQQILVATVIRPAEAKRDADIAAAEAASRVAELTAEGQAKRVEGRPKRPVHAALQRLMLRRPKVVLRVRRSAPAVLRRPRRSRLGPMRSLPTRKPLPCSSSPNTGRQSSTRPQGRSHTSATSRCSTVRKA